ncbi:GrpB family protein [Candidatus Endomicrobiellum cubanum]|uniref:GrpB family protein n=1 Tax=Candidatus Endomicrobiellum cubanum TaxID=3242325 RepID=UPI003593DD70
MRIEVVPYNPNWPAMFENEKRIIHAALGDNCVMVYHVGSTSVPGLAAKPKIDIVAVAKDEGKTIQNLEKVNYFYKGEWNIPLKYGFAKRGNTDVNLHLFLDKNHPEIELNLRFRDYLRTHPRVCDEYAAVKMKILQDEVAQQKVGKLSFPVYTLRKSGFINKIIRDMGYNRLRVLKCTTEAEWNTAKEFRKKYFNRLESVDLIDGELDSLNHEHFLLYKGVEIIGYADLHIISKSKAKLYVLETVDDKEASSFFNAVIEKWVKVRGYNLTKTLDTSI